MKMYQMLTLTGLVVLLCLYTYIMSVCMYVCNKSQSLHMYICINDKPLDITYRHYTICVKSSTRIHFYM